MRIISEKYLRRFWEKYSGAETPLRDWIKITKSTVWHSFTNVRNDFRHADIYHCCTIFDIGGNKYRLIVKIRYSKQIIFIREVLTHNEYDKDKWKSDCDE